MGVRRLIFSGFQETITKIFEALYLFFFLYTPFPSPFFILINENSSVCLWNELLPDRGTEPETSLYAKKAKYASDMFEVQHKGSLLQMRITSPHPV